MEDKGTLELENNELTITPLGAGQEVGRSCIMLQFKGKKIMLDCGIHPGLTGIDALPFVDLVEADDIDLLLISHFHLDHCGALPWFLTKTTFRGRCFMTHATKAIYRCLLADCIKVSNSSSDQLLYTENDLEASMDKIETINFHEEKEVNGIRFWCYNAGHVLGASMFMIEIAGVKVLYTGDFSRQEDRHLMSAEIPSIRPDVLIIESTYGTHIHEKREDREARFTSIVHDTVTRGGRCLIPVFALGRAQELLLILDEFWSQHPELHHIPIYYASSLAKKCMAVYQTYINAMNDRIKKQIAINNPFVFKHISNLKSIEHFDDVGPCVVMATPGMMQSGLSRELFEAWCPDSRNTCIIAGYCVEGTLAKQILAEPEEIVTLAGTKLARKCQIEYISFSAHTDYCQTSEFVRTLRPPQIVLVHGEANEMNRLKAALQREYEDDPRPPTLHNPKNTEPVRLHFRGEKIAKVSACLKAISQLIENDEQLIGVLNALVFTRKERIKVENGSITLPSLSGLSRVRSSALDRVRFDSDSSKRSIDRLANTSTTSVNSKKRRSDRESEQSVDLTEEDEESETNSYFTSTRRLPRGFETLLQDESSSDGNDEFGGQFFEDDDDDDVDEEDDAEGDEEEEEEEEMDDNNFVSTNRTFLNEDDEEDDDDCNDEEEEGDERTSREVADDETEIDRRNRILHYFLN